MGLFNVFQDTSPRTVALKELVAYYKRLRVVRLRLNDQLAGRLSKSQIGIGAKRLGMRRQGAIFFNTDSEVSVLMDYCLYDVYERGRNTIDQYLCECPPASDSAEMTCLRAMQRAAYALVAILRVEPGVGCHIRDIFTEETHLLVDLALSTSGVVGGVFATRLLDFGDFVTSTGAVLPMGVLNDEQLDDLQQTFNAAEHDVHADPCDMIRGFLEHGASDYIQYAETDPEYPLGAGEELTFAPTSAPRQHAPRRRQPSKALRNRRCRCGSGKMFKNCCGRR